jgi:hypothetical protein
VFSPRTPGTSLVLDDPLSVCALHQEANGMSANATKSVFILTFICSHSPQTCCAKDGAAVL